MSDAADAPPGRRIMAALPVHAVVAFGALAIVWEIVAQFTPPYLFPDLWLILKAFVGIFTTWDLLLQGLITWSAT